LSALLEKRIVITRAVHQAGELEEALRWRGAIPLSYPCIQIEPVPDASLLCNAIYEALAGKYDWLILTSANTVQTLHDQLVQMNIAPAALGYLRVGVVGAGTAAAAQSKLGFQAEFIPSEYTGEQFAQALFIEAGQRVFLPQSAIAGDDLSAILRNRGVNVTVVPAYQTVIGRGGIDLVPMLRESKVDAVTFTSASTVKNFLVRLEAEGGTLDLLSPVSIGCIGSKTAASARLHQLNVHVVPSEHTVASLVEALEMYYADHKIGES